MSLYQRKIERIKNLKGFVLKRDFNYGSLSFLCLGLLLALGVFLQLILFPSTPLSFLMMIGATSFVAALVLVLFPLWAVAIALTLLLWVGIVGWMSFTLYPITAIAAFALLLSCSLQLIYHWDKVIVLRLGKFHAVKGPGLLFLIPLVDRIAEFLDMRIRATDFSAEKTLTKDTVPVHVDALCFWMIWDAKKAVLEVEDYTEAVILSAQTALRDAIGKHPLSSLLCERESLGREIQQALDAKTNPWGVSILSVEITDIIIPKELEDALSKQAQAEREKESRIILGAAEVEIAQKFNEASAKYKDDPIALQLRSMNMIYEGIRQNNSMMLLPASILDKMDLGSVLGTVAMRKVGQLKQEEGEKNK